MSADNGLAPIALFAYRRRDKLEQTVQHLAANELAAGSRLIVFSDGAKTPEVEPQVAEVREFIRSIQPGLFQSVEVIERQENWGLARSLIAGITETLKQSDRVVVVEDDIVTSPHFLRFMNDALEMYQSEDAVRCISGHLLPIAEPLPESFFLRGANWWGWATWRKAWAQFEPNVRLLLRSIRSAPDRDRFNFEGAYAYERLLDLQRRGRIDSWAVRWHASCFLTGGHTLYPGRTLVRNVGLDASGENGDNRPDLSQPASATPISLERQPVREEPEIYRAHRDFWWNNGGVRFKKSRLSRLVSNLKL